MNNFYRHSILLLLLFLGCQADYDDGHRQLQEEQSELIQLPFAAEKHCYNEASNCNLRVAMQCRYQKKNGQVINCIDLTDNSTTPFTFLRLTKERCEKLEELRLDIRFRMCNDNNHDFFRSPGRSTYARFRARNFADRIPAKIAANTCYTFKTRGSIDACKQAIKLDMAMDGILAKRGPGNYCRCYMHKYSNIEITSATPSASPSEKPSMGPTKSPTFAPTLYPTVEPTLQPTTTTEPTVNPSSEGCELSNVIITELASPFNETRGNYIELYFGQDCGGHTIRRNLRVVRYLDGKKDFILSPYRLKDRTIADDGYMIICSSKNGSFVYGEGICDDIGKASIHGTETIAVIEKTGKEIYDTIDIFGMLSRGKTSLRSNQDFTGGRAVRKITASEPSATWDPTGWIVIRGNGSQGLRASRMDPRDFKETAGPPKARLLITEIFYPQNTFTPRHIEMYAPRFRDRESLLDDNLKLVLFKSNETEPDWNSAIDLNFVNANGYIVVCNVIANYEYKRRCDVTIREFNSLTNSNGSDQLAIINGNSDSFYPVDVYGVIGEDAEGTNHEFRGKRIVRKYDAVKPSYLWWENNWITEDLPAGRQNDLASRGDPGIWLPPLSASPSAIPSSSPSFQGPSKRVRPKRRNMK